MMRSRGINYSTDRRGLVIVVVLVCIALMTLLFATVLKTTMAWRRQVRAEEKRTQVEWLADSAVARAVAKMKADPGYTGEEWKPSVFENPDTAATVTISVASEEQTQITVIAQVDGAKPVTVERSLTIPNRKDDNDD